MPGGPLPPRSANAHDELTVTAGASFHIAAKVVNAAGLDSTAITSLGGASRMPDTVERLALDNDGKGRHAAGGQAHLALAIRASSHMLDASSPL